MHAARLVQGRDDLEYAEVPDPVARPGWAVVSVAAAGLCHTDLHVMSGVQFSTRTGIDYTVTRPRILGHEVAGTVVSVGDSTDEHLVGTRVAVGGRGGAGTTPGMHIDGGFAELCAVPVAAAVPIPDEVDFDAAAVATDSVNASYGAVVRAGAVGPDSTVVVVGLGGLGMNAVQIAVHLGATVFGVDIDEERFAAAMRAGASGCSTSVGAFIGERPNVILDFVGGATTRAGIETVALGGRVVLVGLDARTLEIDPTELVLGRKSLIGSLGAYSTADFVAVLDLLASGAIRPSVEVVEFGLLNDAYARLATGKVRGRLVTHPRGGIESDRGLGRR